MENINIMIGRFQPFTKGHMKCVDYAWDKLKIPTVIAMIETPPQKTDKKHPFSSDMLLPYYEEMFENNKKIEKIILVKNADIVKIGDLLYNEGYQIQSWTCGTDRIDSYTRMATNYKEKAHLADNFQMLEIKRSDEDVSATKMRNFILDDNFHEFNNLMPPISLKFKLKLKSYFDALKAQIKIIFN